MARYGVNNALAGTQQNMSSSFKTLIAMFATSGSARRGKLYDVAWGTNGTPADNNLEVDVSRMTADGTGTSATSLPLDPADAAALSTCKVNYTAEPTVTAASAIADLPTNQRASYRWVAFPGGEIVWPATANNGLVIRAKSPSGYTSTVGAMAHFEEQ